VGARLVEPVSRHEAARLSDFVDEALRELDVDVDVPVHVIDRHAPPNGLVLSPTVAGWANRAGVFLSRDLLDRDDETVREIVVEEVAHYWHRRAHPRVANSELHGELFAAWLVLRVCRAVLVGDLDATSRYRLGRYAGAALAGSSQARDDLEAAGADHVLRLVDRLDGQADAQDLATQLAIELDGR
jgi:hypothetical protein